EVRASNAAALAMYRKLGFVQKSVRKGYYDHPREDAVIMMRELLEKGGHTMLSEDPAILDLVRKESPEFRTLEETHQRLEHQLAELTRLHFLTPEEEQRKKRIQFDKLATKEALLGGITLSMPVFLYHLWKFIEPALLPGERRWIVPFLAIASVFFAMGVSFANFVIVPLALQFMLQFGIDRALVPQLGVGFYVDFNVKFLLTFGFAFELPLAITLLSRLRVVTPDLLALYSKHAIMFIIILSAILTPTSDLFNL